MRVIALFIALAGLTACGVTKQVKFTPTPTPAEPTAPTASVAKPLPVMTMPPLPTVATESTPDAVASPAATTTTGPAATGAGPANAPDDRLSGILVEYRADVEEVLGLIWKKPLPSVTDPGEVTGYLFALDRVLKINAKLQKVKHLGDADHRMLIEGREVMESVRASLVTRGAELAPKP